MSWKYNVHNPNNGHYNLLSVNSLTIRDAYNGQFIINGTLQVKKATTLYTLSVEKDAYLHENVYIEGNAIIDENVSIKKKLRVYDDVTVNNNVHIDGNLKVMQNYEIDKNLHINGNLIQFNKDKINNKYNVTFIANKTNVGINKYDAEYTVDVNSDSNDKGFRIQSNTLQSVSILAENKRKKGIQVVVNEESSKFVFYDGIKDSMINVNNTGSMTLTSPSIIANTSSFIINNIDNYLSSNIANNVTNTNVIIYDNNTTKNTNSLQLVSKNVDTSLLIREKDGCGIQICSGKMNKTINRSKASISVLDTNKDSITSQVIIQGTNKSKLRSTLGINRCHVNNDIHALDVNGPVIISHTEICITHRTNNCHDLVFCENTLYQNNGLLLSTIQYNNPTITYTTDGGNTWLSSFLISSINIDCKIHCAYIYNDSFSLMGGQYGLLLYSIDNMKTWNKFDGLLLNETIKSIVIIKDTSLYTICILYGKNSLGYFTLPSFRILQNLSSGNKFTLNESINTYTDGRSLFYSKKPNISANTNSLYLNQTINQIIYNTTTKMIYALGDYAITFLYYNSNNINNLFIYETNPSYFLPGMQSYTKLYNAIDDTYMLVISNTEIRKIIQTNNLLLFSKIPGVFINGINDIYMYDNKNAIAVGVNNTILISDDTGLSWNNITTIINNISDLSDNDELLNSTTNDVRIISVCMSNINTFILLTSQLYDSKLVYKVYSCYFPTIFNTRNTKVLDVIGNMLLVGDLQGTESIYINKNATIKGNILANNNVFVDNTTYTSSLHTNSIDGIESNSITIGLKNPSQDVIVNGNSLLINTKNNIISTENTYYNNNVHVNGIIHTQYINTRKGNLFIGSSGQGGKNVYISRNAIDGIPNNIYIGDSQDNVTISGNSVNIQGSINSIQNQIQLRMNSIDEGGSGGSGILIRDYKDNVSGFIRLNSQLDGYVFKSSTLNSNVLNIRVNDLTITNKVDKYTGLPIQTGLVVLKNTSQLYNDTTIGNNICTMTTIPIDVNNIIVGNVMANDNINNRQTITSDLQLRGNVLCTNNAIYNKDVLMYGNIYNPNNTFLHVSNMIAGNTTINGALLINSSKSVIQNDVEFIRGNLYIPNHAIINKIQSNTINSNTIYTDDLHITKNIIFPSTYEMKITDNLSIGQNANIAGTINSSLIRTSDNVDTDYYGSNGSIINIGGFVTKKKSYFSDDMYLCMKNIRKMIPLATYSFVRNRATSLSLDINTQEYYVVNQIDDMSRNGVYKISTSFGTLSNSLYENVFNDIIPNTADTNYLVGINYRTIDGLTVSSLSKTLIDNTMLAGEYITIEFPIYYAIAYYIIKPNIVSYGMPCSWVLCGSVDGIQYYTLDKKDNMNIITTPSYTIINENMKYYKYFRLIITKVKYNTQSSLQYSIKQIELYGYNLREIESKLYCAGSVSILGNVSIKGITKINNTTNSTNSSNGALIVDGGIGVHGNSYLSNLFVEKTTQLQGNVVVEGELYIKGSLKVQDKFSFNTVVITDTSESLSLGTGALQLLYGGASINGNCNVGKNMTVGNNLYVTKHMYTNGTVTVENDLFTKGNIYSNIVSKNVIIEEGGTFTCNGTYVMKDASILSNIESSNIYTGAFKVVGGIGVTKNVNIGGDLYIQNNTIVDKNVTIQNGNIIIKKDTSYIDSQNIIVNNLQCMNISNSILSYTGNTISNSVYINSTTSSISPYTGTLINKGGTGLHGNCHIGGSVVIYNANTFESILPFPYTSTLSDIQFTNTIPSTIPNIQNSSVLMVSNSTTINAYKNGKYVLITSCPVYDDGIYTYFGSNTFHESRIPWISTYLYSNVTGLPIVPLTSLATIIDNTSYAGEWIQLYYPYKLKPLSYTILLQESSNFIKLESNPISWILVGIVNDVYTILHTVTNYVIVNNTVDIVMEISNTRIYDSFRFIITKVKSYNNSSIGVCFTGLFKFLISGVPYLTPQVNTVQSANMNSLSSNATSSGISNTVINTDNTLFIGPETFAGNSSLTIFGDSTTYGKHNIFRDVTIGGNINSITYKKPIMLNGNVVVYGNLEAGHIKATTYTSLSDYRIKSNIHSLDITKYTVDHLHPVSYYNLLDKREDIGLIAHELQSLYPFLVTGIKDDTLQYQSVNYTALISLLILEIQQLKKKILHVT